MANIYTGGTGNDHFTAHGMALRRRWQRTLKSSRGGFVKAEGGPGGTASPHQPVGLGHPSTEGSGRTFCTGSAGGSTNSMAAATPT